MPTDETTLADRVREARGEMRAQALEARAGLLKAIIVLQTCGKPFRFTPDEDAAVLAALDAYAAAIRAEHAAEIAALKAVLERIADFDCREAGVTDRTYCGHCPACIAHDAIDAARASETRGRE